MWQRFRRFLLMLLILGSPCTAGSLTDSTTAMGRNGRPCNDIPADRHWTGALFNPAGHETGYYRARCIQQAAERSRDPDLCTSVRERRSRFFDGSGTSAATCLGIVKRRIGQDVQAARNLRPIQRPMRVALYRNGNGRDIDVVVATSGGAGRGLWLTVEALLDDGRARTLRSERQPLDDAPGELTVTIGAAELTRALGEPLPSGPIKWRVTLARRLVQADERAAYALAPQVRLSSTLDTLVTLDDLERAPLTRVPPDAR